MSTKRHCTPLFLLIKHEQGVKFKEALMPVAQHLHAQEGRSLFCWPPAIVQYFASPSVPTRQLVLCIQALGIKGKAICEKKKLKLRSSQVRCSCFSSRANATKKKTKRCRRLELFFSLTTRCSGHGHTLHRLPNVFLIKLHPLCKENVWLS